MFLADQLVDSTEDRRLELLIAVVVAWLPIIVYYTHQLIPNSKGNPFIGGVKYTGVKKWRFSTDTAVYLVNGARYADGYYGTLIGSYGRRIE